VKLELMINFCLEIQRLSSLYHSISAITFFFTTLKNTSHHQQLYPSRLNFENVWLKDFVLLEYYSFILELFIFAWCRRASNFCHRRIRCGVLFCWCGTGYVGVGFTLIHLRHPTFRASHNGSARLATHVIESIGNVRWRVYVCAYYFTLLTVCP